MPFCQFCDFFQEVFSISSVRLRCSVVCSYCDNIFCLVFFFHLTALSHLRWFMNSLTNLHLLKCLLSFFKCRQSQVGSKVLDFVHLPQTCSVPYASIVGRSSLPSTRVRPRGRMVLERSWSKRVIVQGDLSICCTCCQLEKEKSSQESSSFCCLGRKDWVHCLGVNDGLRVYQ